MKDLERFRGYIIAKDGEVFKVRVQGGLFDGKKLRVVSTHENCQLAIRLEVDFLVGTIQGKEEPYLAALDAKPIMATKCDELNCNCSAEVLIEVSSYEPKFNESPNAEFIRSCLVCMLLQIKRAISSVQSPIVKVINLTNNDSEWRKIKI